MLAAVDLEELAFARHPLAAAAVLRRAAGPDRPDRSLGQDPPERPLGDADPLAFGEELGQVAVVDPGIGRRRQLDEPRPLGIVKPIGRRPPAVAVGERRRPVVVAGEEAVDLAGRQLEDGGGLVDRQATVHDMLEHVRSMVGPCVGRSLSVLRFHGPEADKVAGRLARTETGGR